MGNKSGNSKLSTAASPIASTSVEIGSGAEAERRKPLRSPVKLLTDRLKRSRRDRSPDTRKLEENRCQISLQVRLAKPETALGGGRERRCESSAGLVSQHLLQHQQQQQQHSRQSTFNAEMAPTATSFERPNELSHNFWIHRYSCLHQELDVRPLEQLPSSALSLGLVQQTPPTGSQEQQQQQHQKLAVRDGERRSLFARCKKLLTRLNHPSSSHLPPDLRLTHHKVDELQRQSRTRDTEEPRTQSSCSSSQLQSSTSRARASSALDRVAPTGSGIGAAVGSRAKQEAVQLDLSWSARNDETGKDESQQQTSCKSSPYKQLAGAVAKLMFVSKSRSTGPSPIENQNHTKESDAKRMDTPKKTTTGTKTTCTPLPPTEIKVPDENCRQQQAKEEKESNSRPNVASQANRMLLSSPLFRRFAAGGASKAKQAERPNHSKPTRAGREQEIKTNNASERRQQGSSNLALLASAAGWTCATGTANADVEVQGAEADVDAGNPKARPNSNVEAEVCRVASSSLAPTRASDGNNVHDDDMNQPEEAGKIMMHPQDAVHRLGAAVGDDNFGGAGTKAQVESKIKPVTEAGKEEMRREVSWNKCEFELDEAGRVCQLQAVLNYANDAQNPGNHFARSSTAAADKQVNFEQTSPDFSQVQTSSDCSNQFLGTASSRNETHSSDRSASYLPLIQAAPNCGQADSLEAIKTRESRKQLRSGRKQGPGQQDSSCSNSLASSISLSGGSSRNSSVGREQVQNETVPLKGGEIKREEPSGKKTEVVSSVKLVANRSQTATIATTSSSRSVGAQLATNLKRLVKRQQSVDSYRMDKGLRNKQRRQLEAQRKLGKTNSAGLSGLHSTPGAGDFNGVQFAAFDGSGGDLVPGVSTRRKTSVCSAALTRRRSSQEGETRRQLEQQEQSSSLRQQNQELPNWNCPELVETIDGGQKSGHSVRGRQAETAGAEVDAFEPDCESSNSNSNQDHDHDPLQQQRSTPLEAKRPTLNLSACGGLAGSNNSGKHIGPLATYAPGSFSGSITPTYQSQLPAGHQYPPKKYSDASTISSSLGAHSPLTNYPSSASFQTTISLGRDTASTAEQAHLMAAPTATSQQPSDAENSSGNAGLPAGEAPHPNGADSSGLAALLAKQAELDEHIYDNKSGLGEDMKFLASLPELCDITFLVGETREPVCAVKSVLAARSRVFHKILFGNRAGRPTRLEQFSQSQQQSSLSLMGQSEEQAAQAAMAPETPLTAGLKSFSPIQSQASSQQAASQQATGQSWSVTLDTGVYTSTSPISYSGTTRSGSEQPEAGQRELISQTSQELLVIGPGQTAKPAKRPKKSAFREASQQGGRRLSRIFLKRTSDSSLRHTSHQGRQQVGQLHHQGSQGGIGNSMGQTQYNYLDKMSTPKTSTTMIIEEFEPDVFRQLIEYIHTGCVLLQARTLLGLLNAADYYGLEQLRRACLRFVSCCITVDTVCSLLATAERYIQYKCTKSIVQKVLEFVVSHADEIFKLNAFGLLPEHVVRLILARDGLKADELLKYNGVYTWCEHYCRTHELTNIADVMRNFLGLIQFHKIPTSQLLSEVYPTRVVPDNIFLSALAYQAEPQKFGPQPMQQRRMTLPNPIIHKHFSDSETEDNNNNGTSMIATVKKGTFKLRRGTKKLSKRQQQPDESEDSIRPGSQQDTMQQGGARGKRSSRAETLGARFTPMVQTSASVIASASGEQAGDPTRSNKPSRFRKGSIAQVSLSGVMRLSHKLSIKRRSEEPKKIRKQQSSNQPGADFNDPLQLGQKILSAYLEEQRRREQELAEAQSRRLAEQAEAAELLRRQQSQQQPAASSAQQDQKSKQFQEQQQQLQQQRSSKSGSSSRKSLKDFKRISKRLFTRHASSKQLQTFQSGGGSQTSQPFASQQASQVGGEISSSLRGEPQQAQLPDQVSKDGKEKRRNVFKIKRSETVLETTDSTILPSDLSDSRGDSML